MYHYRGWRYWLEGLYIWLGNRLPPGLVFHAATQLQTFADERGMTHERLAEILSAWLVEKMP